MKELSPYVLKTLDFLKGSGLDPEEAAGVSAAVLYSISKDGGAAHKMVDFIDHLAAQEDE